MQIPFRGDFFNLTPNTDANATIRQASAYVVSKPGRSPSDRDLGAGKSLRNCRHPHADNVRTGNKIPLNTEFEASLATAKHVVEGLESASRARTSHCSKSTPACCSDILGSAASPCFRFVDHGPEKPLIISCPVVELAGCRLNQFCDVIPGPFPLIRIVLETLPRRTTDGFEISAKSIP